MHCSVLFCLIFLFWHDFVFVVLNLHAGYVGKENKGSTLLVKEKVVGFWWGFKWSSVSEEVSAKVSAQFPRRHSFLLAARPDRKVQTSQTVTGSWK